MTIVCLHCKDSSAGKSKLVKSKVLESRTVDSQAQHKGRTARTKTIRRRRQCLDCGYIWHTLEYLEQTNRVYNFSKKEKKVPKYFTYINGLRGPEPQIWHGSLMDGAGKPKANAMTPVALDDNDNRTIEELKLAYPIEAEA